MGNMFFLIQKMNNCLKVLCEVYGKNNRYDVQVPELNSFFPICYSMLVLYH